MNYLLEAIHEVKNVKESWATQQECDLVGTKERGEDSWCQDRDVSIPRRRRQGKKGGIDDEP